jgi:hypothetical protein
MQEADRIDHRGFLSVQLEKYREIYVKAKVSLWSPPEELSEVLWED